VVANQQVGKILPAQHNQVGIVSLASLVQHGDRNSTMLRSAFGLSQRSQHTRGKVSPGLALDRPSIRYDIGAGLPGVARALAVDRSRNSALVPLPGRSIHQA